MLSVNVVVNVLQLVPESCRFPPACWCQGGAPSACPARLWGRRPWSESGSGTAMCCGGWWWFFLWVSFIFVNELNGPISYNDDIDFRFMKKVRNRGCMRRIRNRKFVKKVRNGRLMIRINQERKIKKKYKLNRTSEIKLGRLYTIGHRVSEWWIYLLLIGVSEFESCIGWINVWNSHS